MVVVVMMVGEGHLGIETGPVHEGSIDSAYYACLGELGLYQA